MNYAAIILGMGSINERQRYNVKSPLIGWAHAQNDLYTTVYQNSFRNTVHRIYKPTFSSILCKKNVYRHRDFLAKALSVTAQVFHHGVQK